MVDPVVSVILTHIVGLGLGLMDRVIRCFLLLIMGVSAELDQGKCGRECGWILTQGGMTRGVISIGGGAEIGIIIVAVQVLMNEMSGNVGEGVVSVRMIMTDGLEGEVQITDVIIGAKDPVPEQAPKDHRMCGI